MAAEFNSASDNDIHRTKHPSIDTKDTSSQFSGDSLRPRIGPPPGTYLVQLPKDQIYRIPPPENAHRYEYLTHRKPNRTTCGRCFCYFLAVVLVFLILAAIAVGILYLVYRPEKPRFSVSGVSIAGFNLTSSSTMFPIIDVKMRFQNGNSKIGLIYGKGNAAEVFYNGTNIGNGGFTAFNQPPENIKVIVTALKGSKIQLTSSSRRKLTESEKKGKVPFELKIKAPVQFKFGAVTTWSMTVTVKCQLTVDKLTALTTVVSENCEPDLTVF